MSKYNREEQLKVLVRSLENLTNSLEADPHSGWLNHFRHHLSEAQYLLKNGFTQDDLNSLSTSLRSVYGGMGSFNDYYNPLDKTNIIGKYSSQVYSNAFHLKVTGSY